MSIDSKLNSSQRDESEDSGDSTPETEQNPQTSTSNKSNGNGIGAPQDIQPPKRKGGRKPIYATSEERKQRNRQAQAAFRERRTEYIKQLEETIRVHESNLHNLQTAHRSAAEECLMLRYKNSLLERILLEKGIDVHAELHAKTGSPDLAPAHMSQNLIHPPPIQRTMLNRHHQLRKSISSIAPKAESVQTQLAPTLPPHKPAVAVKGRPTAPSMPNSSPNSASAFTPGPSENMPMAGSYSAVARPPITDNTNPAARQSLMQVGHGNRTTSTRDEATFYPTSGFQNQMEPLDQEYDGHTEMMEDSKIDAPNGSVPYPAGFNGNHQPSMILPPDTNVAGNHLSQSLETNQQASLPNQSFPSMTQLLDQNLDWDPFGLTASMAFPNHHSFQFDQTSMR
ncbi:hypothetical protein CDD82_6611 [Ophiocordyceps australis]|uniref:BZIP domain-containing protein n=1 Tax=Ophiocordyceps australis TaxID=1399860 RepID=A0A2C5ZUS2_9HYPO|nr:hypothetical protein CDD82_6611 [Ophiocordyceps australis]